MSSGRKNFLSTIYQETGIMEEWNKNLKLLRILNDDHETKFAAIDGEIEENNGEKKSVE